MNSGESLLAAKSSQISLIREFQQLARPIKSKAALSRQEILDRSLAPSTLVNYNAKLAQFHGFVMSHDVPLSFADALEQFLLLKYRTDCSASDLSTIKAAHLYHAHCAEWPILADLTVINRIISSAKNHPTKDPGWRRNAGHFSFRHI